MPPDAAWIEVRCYDFAQGGFSFFYDEKPAFERLMASFRSPEPIYIAARVHHWRPVLVDAWGGILEPGADLGRGHLDAPPHRCKVPRRLPVPAAVHALTESVYNSLSREGLGKCSWGCLADRVMSRIAFLISVWAGLCILAAGPAGAIGPGDPAEEADSRYDSVVLKNSTAYYGLIESVDDDWLTLIRIQSPRGQQMHLVIQPFDRSQVDSFKRLDEAPREALEQRIAEFRNRATVEAASMDAIKLDTRAAEGLSYRHYASKWFTLDSTADEPSTRRMIVRAQQIFAAYRQILPPRSVPSHPPRLVVLGSMEQYQPLLAKLGLKMKIENPACFLKEQNIVVIGSDLVQLAAVTAKITAQNAQLRRSLRIWKKGSATPSDAADALGAAVCPTPISAKRLTGKARTSRSKSRPSSTNCGSPIFRSTVSSRKTPARPSSGSITSRFTPTSETASIRGRSTTFPRGSMRAWR